MNHITHA